MCAWSHRGRMGLRKQIPLVSACTPSRQGSGWLGAMESAEAFTLGNCAKAKSARRCFSETVRLRWVTFLAHLDQQPFLKWKDRHKVVLSSASGCAAVPIKSRSFMLAGTNCINVASGCRLAWKVPLPPVTPVRSVCAVYRVPKVMPEVTDWPSAETIDDTRVMKEAPATEPD